jgi:hypothetical protein
MLLRTRSQLPENPGIEEGVDLRGQPKTSQLRTTYISYERTVLRETGIVEVKLEQEPAVCNIDQSAFSRPRNFDFSFLKKQWRVQDPTNIVPTTIPSKAESNSQEHS